MKVTVLLTAVGALGTVAKSKRTWRSVEESRPQHC